MRAIGMRTFGIIAASGLTASPAAAQLVLSQVVVDLPPTAPPRVDVEAANGGTERMYVVAEPAEIIAPGTPDERRVVDPDPARSGLLVSPQKMILEPGEHRLIRIAAVAPHGARDRVYRVTVKPVAGEVTGAQSALKVLVGYDMLVIVRPQVMTDAVSARRDGTMLTLANDGSTSVELYDGRQCAAGGGDCRPLPAKRLYAGARWVQPVDPARSVTYTVKAGLAVKTMTFR
ncbi:putative fimbrial protein TcfA [Sphingomonas sp. RIT328]|nr:putative fimbrial protein TcfA [Sphingomonas sp. RIT328]